MADNRLEASVERVNERQQRSTVAVDAAAMDAVAAVTATLVRSADGRDAGAMLRMVNEASGRLLGAAQSGLMMADPRGGVDVVAATNEWAEVVELLQAQVDEGPCLDCIRDDELVVTFDLAQAGRSWPSFAPTATAAGFRGIVAVPLRLNGQAVGGLNLLYTEVPPFIEAGSADPLPSWFRPLARCLADLAVLGLVQEPDARRSERLVEQTLNAFNDRVHVAHAVGMIAGVTGIEPAAAWTVLCRYARDAELALREAARRVTDRSVQEAELTALMEPTDPVG